MTKETEILIPKEYEVKVGDRTYQMKRLGVSSITRLIRFVKDTMSENTERVEKLKASSNPNISDFDDILNIIETIGDEKAYKLFAMMIGEKDYTYFNDSNFGLVEMTTIIKYFLKLNDIVTVKKNATEIKEIMSSVMKDN